MGHFFEDFTKSNTGVEQVSTGIEQVSTAVSNEDLENIKKAFLEEIADIRKEIANISSNKEVTGTNKTTPNTVEEKEREEKNNAGNTDL